MSKPPPAEKPAQRHSALPRTPVGERQSRRLLGLEPVAEEAGREGGAPADVEGAAAAPDAVQEFLDIVTDPDPQTRRLAGLAARHGAAFQAVADAAAQQDAGLRLHAAIPVDATPSPPHPRGHVDPASQPVAAAGPGALDVGVPDDSAGLA